MSDKLQSPCPAHLRNERSLFLATAAWAVTAASLVYVFANLGEIKTIISREYITHLSLSITEHKQGDRK